MLLPEIPNGPHAVALIGWSNDTAIVIDPLEGRRLFAQAELRALWLGDAIEVQPSRPLPPRP